MQRIRNEQLFDAGSGSGRPRILRRPAQPHDRRADLSRPAAGGRVDHVAPAASAPGLVRSERTAAFSAFKWVFGSSFNFRNFDFNANQTTFDQLLGPVLNATNPNLNSYESRGGKLLVYHGWEDSVVNPQDTINYINRVVLNQVALGHATLGNAVTHTQQFARLFMAPGMNHCIPGLGGARPENFDPLPQLVQWVEQGIAPQRVIATKPAGFFTPAITRPLCPFPMQARYNGTGSTNLAANFSCVVDTTNANQVPAPRYEQ